MFRIPGIPVHNSGGGGGDGRRQTKPYRHPSPFITYNDKINHDEEESYDGTSPDTKSLLTNHWVNVHANSFQPIVRENLTPPANSPLLYVHATVPTREVVIDTRAGMSDEEEEDTTPLKKDDEDTPPPKDDDDADNEVDSILKDERLQQRYDQRRKYKRQRSRSRMSMVCGRKTPAERAKRRRLLNNDEPVQLEIKNTNKPNVLSSIMKYAKYPVYVSSNIMSVYLVLSYMGVDVSQYTANLTRVSTSLLRHINSAAARGGAMADVLGRLTPGALMERLVAPLAASLAALK